MKQWKIPIIMVGLLSVLLLGGCSARTLNEMYSIPRRSARNESLRAAIENEMQTRSYAAPLSGENRESVQVSDLDGDGTDEYVTFTRNTSDGALQILVFHQDENDYFRLWKTIDCKGSSFEKVLYSQIDDKAGCELVVGVRINERVTSTVAVYSFGSGEAEKLKSMIYRQFLCVDLNDDGLSEILIIQNGTEEIGPGVARLYTYKEGNIEGSDEVRLSEAPDEIRRIIVNKSEDNEAAVYVTSSWNDSGVITDMLLFQNGKLSNVVQAGIQNMNESALLPEDIDGDGILELPSLQPMMYSTSNQNLIRWFSFDSKGDQYDKYYTYHSLNEGWYIVLNKSWIDRITVEKTGSTYTFLMWNNSYGTAVPIFSIYVLRGKDRDLQAAAQNRFALYRGDETVFSAKLESASAIYGITENYLTEHFLLIRQDWKSAES